MSARHRMGLLAFAPETTTSEIGVGKVFHPGSMMRVCASWLRMIHNRNYFILRKLWGHYNYLGLSILEHLSLCPSCRSRYPTTGEGPASVPCQGSRVKAAVSQLSSRRTKSWLSSIVTGDEMLVLYASIPRKQSWCPPLSIRKRQNRLGSIR